MNSDEETADGISHAPFGCESPLNRPFCWKHGHEFPNAVGFHKCRRCGLDQTRISVIIVLLVPLMAFVIGIVRILGRIRRWLYELR